MILAEERRGLLVSAQMPERELELLRSRAVALTEQLTSLQRFRLLKWRTCLGQSPLPAAAVLVFLLLCMYLRRLQLSRVIAAPI